MYFIYYFYIMKNERGHPVFLLSHHHVQFIFHVDFKERVIKQQTTQRACGARHLFPLNVTYRCSVEISFKSCLQYMWPHTMRQAT